MLPEIYKKYKAFKEETGKMPAKLRLSHDMLPDILGADYVIALLKGEKPEVKEYGGVPVEWVDGEKIYDFIM